MILAMIASSISIGSVWWSNNEGKVTFSLWTFKMETEFAEFEAAHDEVCETPNGGAALAAYCLKIRAARATTIMTAISALFTAAFHIRGYCKDSSWLGWTGIATNALAVGSAGFAIRMGLVLKADSSLNEDPMAGFIFIAMACGLAGISLMLAVSGKCLSCKGSEQYKGGDYKGYGGRPPVGGAAPIGAPSGGYGQRQQLPPAMMPLPPAPVMTMTAGVAPPPGFNGGSAGYSAPQSGGSSPGDFGIQPMGMPPLSGGANPQAYGNPQGYGGSPGSGQPGISFGGQRQVAPSMPALPPQSAPQYRIPTE